MDIRGVWRLKLRCSRHTLRSTFASEWGRVKACLCRALAAPCRRRPMLHSNRAGQEPPRGGAGPVNRTPCIECDCRSRSRAADESDSLFVVEQLAAMLDEKLLATIIHQHGKVTLTIVLQACIFIYAGVSGSNGTSTFLPPGPGCLKCSTRPPSFSSILQACASANVSSGVTSTKKIPILRATSSPVLNSRVRSELEP